MTSRSVVNISFLVLSAAMPALITLAFLTFLANDTWSNEPFHSSLEAAGSTISLVLTGMLFFQLRYKACPTYFIWIALAFLCMGILDGIHSLTPVGAAFFWTHGLSVFFGGLIFAAVNFNDRILERAWVKFLPRGVALLSVAIGTLLIVVPQTLPNPFTPNEKFSLLARFVNLVGAFGYLTAVPRLALYKGGPHESATSVIFAAQCLLMGVSAGLFLWSDLWTPVWWLFHVLRFISYVVVLRYVFASYKHVQEKELTSNEMLRENNLELKVLNDELEAFSYSVSHDLRAPLRGIDGFSQALLEDYSPQLDDTAKGYIKFIREGVQRMGQLIDNLLGLSRLTRAELISEPIDLSSLAEKIVDRLRLANPAREVVVKISPAMRAHGDRGLIEAALENLLSNAWKFTSNKAEPQITFGVDEEGPTRTYFVRDNGAGFDMRYVGKLFGVFQRLHLQSEFRGTGIGLATVRRIVQRHGGRVWGEGRPGEGAVFYFTLPGQGGP